MHGISATINGEPVKTIEEFPPNTPCEIIMAAFASMQRSGPQFPPLQSTPLKQTNPWREECEQ